MHSYPGLLLRSLGFPQAADLLDQRLNLICAKRGFERRHVVLALTDGIGQVSVRQFLHCFRAKVRRVHGLPQRSSTSVVSLTPPSLPFECTSPLIFFLSN